MSVVFRYSMETAEAFVIVSSHSSFMNMKHLREILTGSSPAVALNIDDGL